MSIGLDEMSAKVRTGPPIEDEADLALAVWAGVLPLRPASGVPRPDGVIPAGMDLPAYLDQPARWSTPPGSLAPMGTYLAPGVLEIDTLLGGWTRMTAGYLVEGPAPVLIETGSQSSVPALLEALKDHGVAPTDLAGVAVTHIHLDHAGGVGDVARAFPNATVYVHPKGARHLADPERLVRSAAMVYGDLLDSLYGRLDPTPSERIHILEDGEDIQIGGDGSSPRSTPPATPSTTWPSTTARAGSCSPVTRWASACPTWGSCARPPPRPTSTWIRPSRPFAAFANANRPRWHSLTTAWSPSPWRHSRRRRRRYAVGPMWQRRHGRRTGISRAP